MSRFLLLPSDASASSPPTFPAPRRGFDRLIGVVSDRWWTATRPRLARLVYADGGLGDDLMLTAIARAARAAGTPLHVATSRPELWTGNRDPASVQTEIQRWWYAHRRGWIDTEIVHLGYRTGAPGHIAEQMATRAGLILPANWRPVIHIDESPPRQPKRIVLQNSCRGARYAADTKEWPQANWAELTTRLARDFELVHVGLPTDPPLPHVHDSRGATSLSQVATLIRSAACFLGLESGLMHVAAAMHTPAVIVYGGRSRPAETGYAFNTNLTRAPACAGCALNTGCPHDMICMNIPVTEVEAAVRANLSNS